MMNTCQWYVDILVLDLDSPAFCIKNLEPLSHKVRMKPYMLHCVVTSFTRLDPSSSFDCYD